jgi:hypothetical protein
MASVLTSLYPEGIKLWTRAEASDHARPIDFAVCAHNAPILLWLKKQGVVPRSSGISSGDESGGSGSGSPTRLSKHTDSEIEAIITASHRKHTAGTAAAAADCTAAGTEDEDSHNSSKDNAVVVTEDKVNYRYSSRRGLPGSLGSGGAVPRGSRSITRTELERMRVERRNSYLDTICQEMKSIEDEFRELYHRPTAMPREEVRCGNGHGRSILGRLLSKGSLVVVTAGAAALGAYLRTMQL